MMTADSLHAILSFDLSFRCSAPCHRARLAGAFASHVVRHPALSSYVQAICPERTMSVAWQALAGGLAVHCAASPGRRRLERKREAKAEGKIKGRGTPARENPVCTWGWRGTRLGVAACREGAQCRIGIGEFACFARRTAPVLDGAAP